MNRRELLAAGLLEQALQPALKLMFMTQHSKMFWRYLQRFKGPYDA